MRPKVRHYNLNLLPKVNWSAGNNYLLPVTNGSTYVVDEKDAAIANELEGEIAKLRTWLEANCNFNSMLPWLPLRLLPAKMDSDMKNSNNDMDAIREAIKSQLEAVAGWVDTDQVKKRAKEKQNDLSTAVAKLRKSADDILKVVPESNKDASVELRDILYAVAKGLGNKEQRKVMSDEELQEELQKLEGQKGQKLEELEKLEQKVLRMLKLKEPEESEEPNKQEERKKWNELVKEWNELDLGLKEKKEQKERKLKDMKNMKLKELGLEKLKDLKNKVQSVIDVVMPEDSATLNGKKLIEHLDPQKQLLDKIVQLANGRVQQATGFLHIEISIRDSE